MKLFYLVLLFLIGQTAAFAQLNASFSKDTIELQRSKIQDRSQTVSVKLEGTLPQYPATISFSVDPAVNSQGAFDQTAFPIQRTIAVGTGSVEFPVTILKGESKTTSWARIQMAYNNGSLFTTKTLTLKISDEPQSPSSGKDEESFFDKITYLNAFSFDFNSKPVSDYVGKFNVFHYNEGQKFGVNVGIMKINYGSDDSTAIEHFRTDNVLFKPLDSQEPGEPYLRQYNRYSTLVQNRAWSFYAQPLWRLNVKGKGSRIFLHGHIELLVNKFKVTTKISNIAQDTAYFPASSSRLVVRQLLSSENVSSNTFLNGYFGTGLTFDLDLGKKANLLLQGTLGGTTNYPQQASAPNTSSSLYYSVRGADHLMGFYLVRGYYCHPISEAAKVVLAADIRGLLPRYNPLYAAYLGINLKVEEALKFLFK